MKTLKMAHIKKKKKKKKEPALLKPFTNMIFFFLFFKFIYLFIYGCVGSLFLREGFL